MTSHGKYQVTTSRPVTPVSFSNQRQHSRLTDSSLPPTILSGVVWHNSPGLFSRWRQVFLILNRDTLRWHHIHKTSSINHHQVGPTIASLNLILISDVSFVERKGYLTICIEAGGVGSNFFRRTSMLRHWGELIKEAVLRKREEFGCISLSGLSLFSSSVGGTEYEINERRRPVRSQRFFRSRSSGNLLEDHEEKQETRDHQLNYKQCLIQQDEEENNFDEFQSNFERRLQFTPNNVNHQFRRYS